MLFDINKSFLKYINSLIIILLILTNITLFSVEYSPKHLQLEDYLEQIVAFNYTSTTLSPISMFSTINQTNETSSVTLQYIQSFFNFLKDATNNFTVFSKSFVSFPFKSLVLSNRGSMSLSEVLFMTFVAGVITCIGHSVYLINQANMNLSSKVYTAQELKQKQINAVESFTNKEDMMQYISTIYTTLNEVGGYFIHQNDQWVVFLSDIGNRHSVTIRYFEDEDIYGIFHNHTLRGVEADPLYVLAPSWTDIIVFLQSDKLKESIVVIGESDIIMMKKPQNINPVFTPLIEALKQIDINNTDEEIIRYILKKQLYPYLPSKLEIFDLGEGDIRKGLHANSSVAFLKYLLGLEDSTAYYFDQEGMNDIGFKDLHIKDTLKKILKEHGKTIADGILKDIDTYLNHTEQKTITINKSSIVNQAA